MSTTKKNDIREPEQNDIPNERDAAPAVTPDSPDYGEELVTYAAPLSTKDEPDIFVAVNGESIRIRRGETVRIKRKFLAVLQDAERQKLAARRYQERARRESERPMAEF